MTMPRVRRLLVLLEAETPGCECCARAHSEFDGAAGAVEHYHTSQHCSYVLAMAAQAAKDELRALLKEPIPTEWQKKAP